MRENARGCLGGGPQEGFLSVEKWVVEGYWNSEVRDFEWGGTRKRKQENRGEKEMEKILFSGNNFWRFWGGGGLSDQKKPRKNLDNGTYEGHDHTG